MTDPQADDVRLAAAPDGAMPLLARPSRRLAESVPVMAQVRVANDGSMRIVRIVPVGSGEAEPGPSN